MHGRYGVLRQRCGFTLIELVTVMVIIGALSTLAYPKMATSYYRLEITGAARKLQNDIRYAQQMALDDHLKIDVIFDAANERYRVADVAANANLTDPFTRSAGVTGSDWTTGLYVDYPNNSELKAMAITSSTSGTLRFSTMGHPADTSDVELTANFDIILACQSITKTVRVSPATGVVTVL